MAAAPFPGGLFVGGSFRGEGIWGVGEASPISIIGPPFFTDAFLVRYDF